MHKRLEKKRNKCLSNLRSLEDKFAGALRDNKENTIMDIKEIGGELDMNKRLITFDLHKPYRLLELILEVRQEK